MPWYRSQGLSTVDNLDQTSGQAALVFLLAGKTDGAFGIHQAWKMNAAVVVPITGPHRIGGAPESPATDATA